MKERKKKKKFKKIITQTQSIIILERLTYQEKLPPKFQQGKFELKTCIKSDINSGYLNPKPKP
jgi:hypothetical protein